MRLWFVLLGVLMTTPAAADSVWPPCDECAIALPDQRQNPVPLLVVLHGDQGRATSQLALWREPALERGWAVLALQCPAELGCEEGRWYNWSGDPKWIVDQIDRLAVDVKIDRSQIFLAGWSGGAAYLGMHMRSWQGFAGLVMHGGGLTPSDGRCAARALPVYFLVGDKNVYHSSTGWFRDYLAGCRSKLGWDVMKNADHTDEYRALTGAKATQILDWLTKHAAR